MVTMLILLNPNFRHGVIKDDHHKARLAASLHAHAFADFAAPLAKGPGLEIRQVSTKVFRAIAAVVVEAFPLQCMLNVGLLCGMNALTNQDKIVYMAY